MILIHKTSFQENHIFLTLKYSVLAQARVRKIAVKTLRIRRIKNYVGGHNLRVEKVIKCDL